MEAQAGRHHRALVARRQRRTRHRRATPAQSQGEEAEVAVVVVVEVVAEATGPVTTISQEEMIITGAAEADGIYMMRNII